MVAADCPNVTVSPPSSAYCGQPYRRKLLTRLQMTQCSRGIYSKLTLRRDIAVPADPHSHTTFMWQHSIVFPYLVFAADSLFSMNVGRQLTRSAPRLDLILICGHSTSGLRIRRRMQIPLSWCFHCQVCCNILCQRDISNLCSLDTWVSVATY